MEHLNLKAFGVCCRALESGCGVGCICGGGGGYEVESASEVNFEMELKVNFVHILPPPLATPLLRSDQKAFSQPSY